MRVRHGLINFGLIVISLGASDGRGECRQGEIGMKRGLMGPWISPTSSQLRVGWPWRYAGCQRSMDWEGKLKQAKRTERVKCRGERGK